MRIWFIYRRTHKRSVYCHSCIGITLCYFPRDLRSFSGTRVFFYSLLCAAMEATFSVGKHGQTSFKFSVDSVTPGWVGFSGPYQDLKKGGGEICWPILSILTATVFSCSRIRGGGRHGPGFLSHDIMALYIIINIMYKYPTIFITTGTTSPNIN